MIVVFTGAGLSTASGIPDFRSPGGIWERFDADEFHITRFHADPAGFWQRRARLIAAMDYLDARPNAAHMATAEAAQAGHATVVTQNVDGLHGAAGTPAERLIELHGNGRRAVCVDCGHKEPIEATLQALRPGGIPQCPACQGILKPDVVLFGEPVMLLDEAIATLEGAHHLLVAGTSLQVYPAAGIVHQGLAMDLPVTLCNRDPTPFDRLCQTLRGDVTQTVPQALARLVVQ